MKRKLLLIFIIFNLLFILAGCQNSQYSAEREYWYLQKKAKKIFLNPDASPARQVNKVVKELNNFAKKHPNTQLEISAEFSIASLYIIKKEYSFARQQLHNIIKRHKSSDAVCSEAIFLIGNTYELDNRWEQALANYNEVIHKYPTTARGLDIPLYIAQYYKAKYQPDKMRDAYRQAAVHYEGISQSKRDTALGYTMALMAVETKMATKDIPGAINTLNSVLSSYTNAEMRSNALMNIALLYMKNKDNVKAKETFQRLINDYPKSKLIKNAQQFIKELEKK